jgi:hypothetical protein
MQIELDIVGRPHINGLYWGGREGGNEQDLTDMMLRGEIDKDLLENLISSQLVYRRKLEILRGENKSQLNKVTPTKPNL